MAFTGPVFWRSARTRPERRDATLIAANIAALEDEFAKAEKPLSQHAFLCGEALTLADIQFSHVLFRYFDIDIPRGDFPFLRAYYDRLAQRLAYQRTVMIPYEVLRDTF